MKALVLAAGFGKRLKNLTKTTPKPLIEIAGIPLIYYSLDILKRAGIKDIIINLHFQGDKIRDFLKDGSKLNLNISYSIEPEILGTGGAIKKVEPFFKGEKSFIVINSDIVSDINLSSMIEFHNRSKAIATLGVKRNIKKDLFFDDSLSLKSIAKEMKDMNFGVFTGIQILNEEIFKYTEEKFSSSIDTYLKYIDEKKNINVFDLKNSFWYDLGTLEKNEKFENEIKNKNEFLKNIKKSFRFQHPFP